MHIIKNNREENNKLQYRLSKMTAWSISSYYGSSYEWGNAQMF